MEQRYDNIAILLHWLIAVLIIANIGLAWSLDYVGHDSPDHKQILTVHRSTGATILLIAILRALWRWTHPVPPLPNTLPRWQHMAARTDQFLLYALLFVMPLTGLIDAGGFSDPVHYFFLFDLPLVIAHNEPLGHAAFIVHKLCALVLYALLLIHAAAALYHHYVLKDGILQRILPGRAHH